MEDKRQQGSVSTEINDLGIATITFEHPAHNSLPGRLLALLASAIKEAGENDNAKVIILKSGGERTFCAGASFNELASIDNEKNGHTFFMGFANVINAIRKCPKFVLGRVQGKAIGGGVGLASAVDHCFATKYASIKLSELAIGIGPFVVGPAVERKLGTSTTSQLAIDATEFKDANWAQENGLYAAVFENAEEMDTEINRLAMTLAKSSPKAMAALKQTLWRGTEDWDELLSERATISGTLVLSDFAQNAIQGFLKK